MTRHFDSLGPYMETERARDAVRVGEPAPTGVHFSGMEAPSVQPKTEAEIEDAARRQMAHDAAFAQTPDSDFLGGLSASQGAAEAARSCYCRGWTRENVDAAWAHLTDMQTALAEATKALAEISKGVK